MYHDDVNAVPGDEDEMWALLREHFWFVDFVLDRVPVETKENALDLNGRRASEIGMDVIRYRNVSEELDQRDHFLELGRSLLPYVRRALDERQLTPEFVQQWGKIMFCHGYIAAHYFDDRDDLAPERNRRKGTEASKRTDGHVFLARLILHFMDNKGQPRQRAEESAAKAISSFVDRGEFPDGVEKDWLNRLLHSGKRDQVVSTLSQGKASEEKLRELAKLDVPGLSPIDILRLQA